MLNFLIYFIDFHLKSKRYKTQNNRKFKQRIGEKSTKIFTTLFFFLVLLTLASDLSKPSNTSSVGFKLLS